MEAEMVAAGLSRDELAARLGWSRSRLQRRLKGVAPIDSNDMFVIASAVAATLGKPAAEVIDRMAGAMKDAAWASSASTRTEARP